MTIVRDSLLKKSLSFSFATYFAPAYTVPALKLYKENFKPSDALQSPYSIVGVNVIAADTVKEAKFLGTSQQQQFLSLQRGKPTKLQPPVKDINEHCSPMEKASIEQSLSSEATIIGDKQMVKEKLATFINTTGANEVIIQTQIYDPDARIRSYEIISELME